MSIGKQMGLFAVGWLAALLGLLGGAECYLRWVTPPDLRPYLGEQSGLAGPYRPSAHYGVTYADWHAFQRENEQALTACLPDLQGKSDVPTWAFFGNSFVQAQGMLADTARQRVRDRRIFNLGRNTPLPIRFAQVQMLLETGWRPERILLAIMPTDTYQLGYFPLDSIQVTTRGALTYHPRLPEGPAGWLVTHSRVALMAWVRNNRHRVNPEYPGRDNHASLHPNLRKDLERLFENLSRVSHERHVPVTILMIPEYRQVVAGESFGFQDELKRVLEKLDFDVFDPRTEFRGHPRPVELYLPDRHMTAEGNELLLDTLLTHLDHDPQLRVADRRQATP